MLFRLKQSGQERMDCTAPYDVILQGNPTVREFIDFVLTRGEWGSVGVEDGVWYTEGEPYCEYRNNSLQSELPDELMDRTIVSAKADGGWSLMNYKIVLEATDD